jgi:hypothetical protein
VKLYPKRDLPPDVYLIKVTLRRFFKPLRYVVPHFFRACQNHRSDITQCLAPESKGLNFRLADHPGVDTTFVNTSAFTGTSGGTSYNGTFQDRITSG